MFRRSLGGRGALWGAFALVHAALIGLNLYGQGYPLGDVTGVYRVWAENAADGLVRMGIDVPWVYPILAFAPMTAALALGAEWYGQTWLAIVTVLDAIAFSILIGSARLSRSRRIAAWWWVGFLAVLGPIALGRIDAVTVPLAITGLLFAAGRPRVAAVLLTVGAWVKVWPAALVAALVIAMRRRREVVTVAAALSAGILAVSIVAGAGANAIGFIVEQAGRGLQVEAPLATAWLWQIVAGSKEVTVGYDRDILTFQVEGSRCGCRCRAHDAPHDRRGCGGRAVRGARSAARGARRRTARSALARVRRRAHGGEQGRIAPVRDVARGARSSSASCTGPRGSPCPLRSPQPSPC